MIGQAGRLGLAHPQYYSTGSTSGHPHAAKGRNTNHVTCTHPKLACIYPSQPDSLPITR